MRPRAGNQQQVWLRVPVITPLTEKQSRPLSWRFHSNNYDKHGTVHWQVDSVTPAALCFRYIHAHGTTVVTLFRAVRTHATPVDEAYGT
jgi:hypothetical protein